MAGFASGAVQHLNDDHADACLLLVQVLAEQADATTATVVGVDRLGLELVADGTAGPRRVRLGFDEPASTPDEIRLATVALVRRARS